MNWVAEHHYAMIVHGERLARERTPGKGLDLRSLREGLPALRARLAAGGQSRRFAGAARPSAANARPLEAQ